MRVTQIFLLLFHNSSLFIYWHSDLEVRVQMGRKNQACETLCLRAIAGLEIWCLVHIIWKITERNCSAYDGCAWEVSGQGVVVLLFCFRGGVRGLKCCWNRCSSDFRFPVEIIIVLPCSLLVASNTFLKTCICKMLLATLMMVVMKMLYKHGEAEGLRLWWQLFVTSLQVRDFEKFKPLDFCWTECAWLQGNFKNI
jgi:hypothetical protein